MTGKATMTVIGNSLAAYDNGAGVRGIVNMTTPSTQAMGYTINISSDALGYAQNVHGATQVAQSNDLAKAGSQFGLSTVVGANFKILSQPRAVLEQGYAMSNSFAFGGSNVSLIFQSSAL